MPKGPLTQQLANALWRYKQAAAQAGGYRHDDLNLRERLNTVRLRARRLQDSSEASTPEAIEMLDNAKQVPATPGKGRRSRH